MSSVEILPEELKVGDNSMQSYNAVYTFKLNDIQRSQITALYRTNNVESVDLQMNFFQSSNQLFGDTIKITYTATPSGTETVQTLYLSGSPYTIDEFYAWLISQITTVQLGFDQNILANQGLFNLKVITGTGYSSVKIEFIGYHINQMLGLTRQNSEHKTWLLNVPTLNPVVGIQRFYMPVVKQFNIECTLQKSGIYYYDKTGDRHALIARYVNNIQTGDYALIPPNIPLGKLGPEDLEHFTITIYDQNFHVCKFLDDFTVSITIGESTLPKPKKIITGRYT